jgi:subtilisin family serine protease
VFKQRKVRGAAAGLACVAMVATAGFLASSASADDTGTDVASRKRAAADGKAPAGDKKLLAAAKAAAAKSAVREKADAGDGAVHLVVGFKPGVEAAAATQTLGAAGLRAKTDAALASLNARRVTVPAAASAGAIAKLRADPDVAYVEKDGIVRATVVTPNDTYYSYQSELPQISVPGAWDLTTGSTAVKVAVVDTGVTNLGGELGDALLPGWDYVNGDNDPADDEGHGSAVAALIAGRGDNGIGTAGVCWQCQILPVKVLDSAGNGTMATVAAGIKYAADSGVQIINVSLGGYSSSTVLQDAVTYARGKGILVVASAGNDAVRDRLFPAAYADALAVGGTDLNSDLFLDYDPALGFYGSNWGADWVDVAAPWCTVAPNLAGFANDSGGEDVGEDNYGYFCGTSASAPLVSGIAALVKSRYPGATVWSLQNSLTKTAKQTVTTDFTAFGEVRAGTAVTTVDTTAPKITGATPAQSAKFRGTVTVGATGVSDTGGAGMSYGALYADGKYVGRDTTTPYAVKYNSGRLNRTVKLQWKVYDRAGNSAVYNRSLIADNKVPTVKITSGPKNGAKVKGTVTLKASASDSSGIARVELLINGKVVAKDTTSGYSFKIKVSKYGKKIKVQVRSVDKAGNTATTSARTWKR